MSLIQKSGVERRVYSYKRGLEPTIGDIVVFRHIGDNEKTYCKRIVAEAGDEVRFASSFIEINSMREKYLEEVDKKSILQDTFTLRVPKKGDLIRLDTLPKEDFLFYYHAIQQEKRGSLVLCQLNYYADNILLKTVDCDTIKNVIDLHNALLSLEEYGDAIIFEPLLFIDNEQIDEYRFKEDHFFMVGDNWSNSYDSRYFGFVSSSSLLGEVKSVYLSFERFQNISPLFRTLRWHRIGMMVE